MVSLGKFGPKFQKALPIINDASPGLLDILVKQVDNAAV